MKKIKTDVCFFEPIVMLSTMSMIPSIACYNIPSPSFRTAKSCTLSRKDNASLAWAEYVLKEK